ncbi:hypothetical protein GCM10010401_07170 [Rarobacter faecitabidus]|uniref:Uncharacterized protein n=2 Tax=Rarobacter faecitabidus TaxID=13243 RepID=A0A542Z857_RARFA|nr:hypothetical protein FB461_2408 [Rarobacter faecitabidus]
MNQISADQARPLAAFAASLRADWDQPGILKALSDNRLRGDVHQLTDATLRAVRDPQAKTPAAIGWDRYWPTATLPRERRFCTEPDHELYTLPCRECRAEQIARESQPRELPPPAPRPESTRPRSDRSGVSA